jgi:hypothetical protein
VRRTQLIAAASLALLGLAAIFVVIPYAVVDAPASSGLPPAFMPYVAAALVTLAALGWLVGELRAARAAAPTPESAPAPAANGDWRFAAAATAVLGVSFLLMSTAGYLIGSIALMAGTMALARVKLVTLVVTAVAAPLVLWFLFVHLLATPLP